MYRFVNSQRGTMLLVPVCLLLVIITTAVWAYSQQLSHYATLQQRDTERQALQSQASTSLVLLHNALRTTSAWQNALSPTERGMVSHHQVSVRDANLSFFTLMASAQTPASTMINTRSMQVVRYPILQARPRVPLMLSSQVSSHASILLYPVNTSDATYWKSTALLAPKSPQYQCDSTAQTLCQPLTADSVPFPTDIFSYVFGTPRTAFFPDALPDTTLLQDCNNIAASHSRVIWIIGNCYISRATEIGSESDPVVVIVEDGHIHFAEASTLTGLLITLSRSSGLPRDIVMSSDSMIDGAALISQTLSPQSVIQVTYKPDVLATLQNSDYFQRTAFLPGSWHDF